MPSTDITVRRCGISDPNSESSAVRWTPTFRPKKSYSLRSAPGGRLLGEAASLDSAHRDEIVAERDRYETIFRSVVKAGVADGTFRADLDIDLATIFVLSILNAIERWYRPEGRVDQSALASEIYRFTTSGISREPETARQPY